MKIKLNVPENLSEITLAQYQRWVKIIDKEEEVGTFYQQKMIEIFCGIPHKDSFRMKLRDVTKVTNILGSLFDKKPKLKQRFMMNGVEYGFIPNLDDMTLGEYVDLDTYLGKWQQVEKAMAVLYRPIINTYKNKYTIEEYKAEGQDVYKDMPMDIVLGSMLFFYRLGIDLSRLMTVYLEQNKEKPLPPSLNLGKNGDGINQFLHSLRGILDDLSISLN